MGASGSSAIGIRACDLIASADGLSDRLGVRLGVRSGIRWDEVIASRVAGIENAPPRTTRAVVDRPSGSIQVHVRLFGALAALSAERSIRLDLPTHSTIADVLGVVELRRGASFRMQVLDETGAKRRHCRLFVGGYAVEDLHMQLDGATDPTEIDIILLIAPEGG
jgi:hypothetical protein